jgi:MFS family permease
MARPTERCAPGLSSRQLPCGLTFHADGANILAGDSGEGGLLPSLVSYPGVAPSYPGPVAPVLGESARKVLEVLLSKQRQQLRRAYDEYPGQFWLLLLGSFIDQLGGALVFPFLTLYITRKFAVAMTELGVIIGVYSLTNLVGGILGGALADRLGRKQTLLFGLVVSGLTSLLMGWVGSVALLLASIVVVGLFANVGGPARQAMIADLLPEEKRAQGFGLLRVEMNLAVAIGPTIGGLLATRSFLSLFIADAVTSLITAVFVAFFLHETRPGSRSGAEHDTVFQTLHGYGDVVRNSRFVAFVLICILVAIAAIQMNTTLSVYLRDVHGVSAQGFGFILSLNATMVVLFQFYITRRMRAYRPWIVMAAGSALYGFGYALYGFVSAYVLFLAAMVVITTGEMVFVPTAQALAARMAPEDMRGRYMAAYGLSWAIPGMIGPLLAGLIMDNADPRWVWYAAAVSGLVAAAGFALLHRWLGDSAGEKEVGRMSSASDASD